MWLVIALAGCSSAKVPEPIGRTDCIRVPYRSNPDASMCDKSRPVRIPGTTRIDATYLRGTTYAVSCDPLDASVPDSDAGPLPGCRGLPDDLWSACTLPRCPNDPNLYPVGCFADVPTDNPFYQGNRQTCSCELVGPALRVSPAWTCGL